GALWRVDWRDRCYNDHQPHAQDPVSTRRFQFVRLDGSPMWLDLRAAYLVSVQREMKRRRIRANPIRPPATKRSDGGSGIPLGGRRVAGSLVNVHRVIKKLLSVP